MYDEESRPASEAEAHVEWHINAGVPMGTPGCPWDACHAEEHDEPVKHDSWEAGMTDEERGRMNFWGYDPLLVYGPYSERVFDVESIHDMVDATIELSYFANKVLGES